MPVFYTRILKKAEEDQDLIRKYNEYGDIESAGLLYEKYMHLVYGLCLKHFGNRDRSKDAVMQIFEKLLVELKNHEVKNFKSWLYVLTKNFCLMELRSDKSLSKKISEYTLNFMESTSQMHPIDESDCSEERNKILHQCIEKLKEKQKRCIEQFYFKQKSYKEIAFEMKLNEKEVKSFIQNGKRMLKLCMENHHESE